MHPKHQFAKGKKAPTAQMQQQTVGGLKATGDRAAEPRRPLVPAPGNSFAGTRLFARRVALYQSLSAVTRPANCAGRSLFPWRPEEAGRIARLWVSPTHRGRWVRSSA